jgi:hypothetical protein
VGGSAQARLGPSSGPITPIEAPTEFVVGRDALPGQDMHSVAKNCSAERELHIKVRRPLRWRILSTTVARPKFSLAYLRRPATLKSLLSSCVWLRSIRHGHGEARIWSTETANLLTPTLIRAGPWVRTTSGSQLSRGGGQACCSAELGRKCGAGSRIFLIDAALRQ